MFLLQYMFLRVLAFIPVLFSLHSGCMAIPRQKIEHLNCSLPSLGMYLLLFPLHTCTQIEIKKLNVPTSKMKIEWEYI